MPDLQLDIRTLLLVFAGSFGMLTAVGILLWRLNPAERCTRDWALFSVLGMTASLLIGLRDIVPDFVSVVAGNVLFFMSMGAVYMALHHFLGDAPRRHWYWSPGLAAMPFLLLLTYVWPSTLARIELYSLGQAAFCLHFVRLLLLRPAAPSLRLPQRLMAIPLGLLAAGSLARAAVSPWAETSPDLMHASVVTALYVMIEIVAVTGLAVGWVMLVTSRLHLRLSQSEAEYRSVIKQIPDIFYRTNRAGHLVLISPAITLLGYAAADELLGQPVEKLWQTPAQWAELLAQVQRGPVKDFEAEAVKKDGGLVPVSLSCHYYTDEAGVAVGLEGVIRDITERKQAGQALREEHAQLAERVEARTAELSARTAALDAMNADLTRALASRDEFLAAMSHELRTPLTAILGQADMLRAELSGPLNERQLWQAQTIYDSGQHLLQLINDVLDLARLMSGRLALEVGPVALDELCESCVRTSRRDAKKKRLTLHYTPALEVPVIQADGVRLKQILANLLNNAVKFTPEGGEAGLEVQADAAHQTVRLTVWDSGIGIAADDLPRLFQNFVQLDSRLARDYEGTGLGLSLVQRLAELHGGDVSVESTIGQGSRFTVTLPLGQPKPKPDSKGLVDS